MYASRRLPLVCVPVLRWLRGQAVPGSLGVYGCVSVNTLWQNYCDPVMTRRGAMRWFLKTWITLPLIIDNDVVDFFADTDDNSNPTFIHMSAINNSQKTPKLNLRGTLRTFQYKEKTSRADDTNAGYVSNPRCKIRTAIKAKSLRCWRHTHWVVIKT